LKDEYELLTRAMRIFKSLFELASPYVESTIEYIWGLFILAPRQIQFALGLFVLCALLMRLFHTRRSTRSVRRAAKRKKRKRSQKMRLAQRLLNRIWQKNKTEEEVFRLVRTIDPYAFEELILYAIERNGFKIRRGNSYSGDGGIDGKATLYGQLFLIQAKRYRSYISAKHVEDFVHLCEEKKTKGLFVHTGRTGGLSKTRTDKSGLVTIVSGQKLLLLLTGKPLNYTPFIK